jgi:hypothetical protein
MIRVNSVTRVKLADGAYRISATVSLRELTNCTFVARMREEDGGYQRPLTRSKVNDVAACLARTPVIDGALIVFVAADAQPEYDRAKKLFSFLPIARALELVDGQHRFDGAQAFLAVDERHKVHADIQFYVGQSRAAAAAKFLEIHRKATPVHRGVLAEAQRVAGEFSAWQEDAARLYDVVIGDLRFDGSRGFNLRQWLTAMRRHITRDGVLAGLEHEKRAEVLLGYLDICREQLGDHVRRVSVLHASLAIFPDVLAHARAHHGNAKRAALASVLEPLRDVNVLADGRAKDAIVNIMRAAVLPVSLREEDL